MWFGVVPRHISVDHNIRFSWNSPDSKIASYKTDNLCEFGRISMYQIWDITKNTIRYFLVFVVISQIWHIEILPNSHRLSVLRKPYCRIWRKLNTILSYIIKHLIFDLAIWYSFVKSPSVCHKRLLFCVTRTNILMIKVKYLICSRWHKFYARRNSGTMRFKIWYISCK